MCRNETSNFIVCILCATITSHPLQRLKTCHLCPCIEWSHRLPNQPSMYPLSGSMHKGPHAQACVALMQPHMAGWLLERIKAWAAPKQEGPVVPGCPTVTISIVPAAGGQASRCSVTVGDKAIGEAVAKCRRYGDISCTSATLYFWPRTRIIAQMRAHSTHSTKQLRFIWHEHPKQVFFTLWQ